MRGNMVAVVFMLGLLAVTTACASAQQAAKPQQTARWIWAPESAVNQHVLLRRVVPATAKRVKRVVARVSADDYYKLTVNGQPAGQGPAPAYPADYLYNTLDLTPLWKAGQPNCLAAHAYYQGLSNAAWVSGDNLRGFWLQLDITYADGSNQSVVTDDAWKALTCTAYTGSHKLGYDTGFSEDIDLRLIPQGWQSAGFDDSAWPRATLVQDTPWKLRAQTTPPLKVYEQRPVTVTQKADGHYFVDFGREVVGCLRLRLNGQTGQRVEVRLGEELTAPGEVRYKLRANCTYQDYWTLRDGTQTAEFYEYRGFRYAEVIGAPSPLDRQSVSAVVRHYPFDESAGRFTCNHKDLQALWDLAHYASLMGTQEIYLDCPTREKAQYSLDTHLEMSAVFYQFGDYKLAARAIEALLQSAPDGKLRDVAPASNGGLFTEYTMYPVLMAARYYLYSGDRSFLVDHYDALTRVERYMRTTFGRPDGLLSGTDPVLRDLVDWPTNRRDGHVILPVNTVVSAVYYRLCADMATIARAAGHPDDAATYQRRADQVREAFNRLLWSEADQRYIDGLDKNGAPAPHSSLHSNAMPLAMGLVPPERVKPVVEFVKTRGLRCNMFLAMFLFEALYDHGAADYATGLLTGPGEDTPMHMVREGATTPWEAWDLSQKANASLFHPAGAFTAYVIASRILGIQPTEPGWRTVRIAPHAPAGFTASIRIPTPQGPLSVSLANGRTTVKAPKGMKVVKGE